VKRVLVVVPVLLLCGGCTVFAPHTTRYEPPGIRDVAQPQTGEELYLRNCAWCHGAGGGGTVRGPSLIGDRNGAALTDFMLRTGRMPISDPSARVESGPPSFSPAQVDLIVRFLTSLGSTGPGIPRPDPKAGDLALGEQLYQSNCAACHSSAGSGSALTQERPQVFGNARSGFQAPSLKGASALDVAEAMRTGPGTMPVFGDETFDEKELNSIVRYVLYLEHPSSRGGADLGGIGPVAEGAVAWIVGLGTIVLLARWIGRRTEHG
jgi:ubiquinol-cytochrome c reductase cytochrome c subunit